MQPVKLVPWGFDSWSKKFEKLPERRKIAVLGSTGSIGQSTLEVVRRFPESFEIVSLASYGSNPELLASQIKEFKPEKVAVFSSESAKKIEALCDCKVASGEKAVSELCEDPKVDVVMAAIVGVAGLPSVLAALNAGKLVALANKESLVVAGKLVRKLAQEGSVVILPVDSEHAAIFQALQGASHKEIASLTLTASGGPFLRKSLSELKNVTVEQAIAHPCWKMGAKISVDSATLMNKGLELIEAHYLFGLPGSKLNAIVHPQSIVHGMVNLTDGSSILQASYPDMKEPIAYALNFPKGRLPGITESLNLSQLAKLEFEEIDQQRFPAVSVALKCIDLGEEACLTYNQANEQAVEAFLQGKISFNAIVPFVQEVLGLLPDGSFHDFESLLSYRAQVMEICKRQLTLIKHS